MQKQYIRLTAQDRLDLESLYSKSSLTVKIHRRIEVLLELDKGKSYTEVGKQTGLTYLSMRAICAKYVSKQVDEPVLSCISDKTRSGRPIVISGEERAKITALACSKAPDGRSSWTLRLLADKVVELGICQELSHTYAGEILKKTSYNLTSNAHGALV